MPVSIDPDQQKNEETTKLRHITPVISERWQDVDKVLMEYYFTDGRISVDEYNMAHRGKPKKQLLPRVKRKVEKISCSPQSRS